MHPETLWLAPTRPAMVKGVPYEGFYINLLGTFFFGLIMGAPYYWIIGFVVHYVILRPLASWDANFFRVLRLWVDTKASSFGSELYGAPALAPIAARRAKSAEEYQTLV